MTTALQVFAALIVIYGLIRASRHRSLYPFMPLRHNFGKRRDTLRRVLELLSERRARVLLETGTARHGLEGAKSQGASTILFALWAQRNDARLHSVDISADSIAAARQEASRQQLLDVVQFHQQDSIEFLGRFEEKVDFLYLDSYDYSREDETVQLASQRHHLAEFNAIEERLHDSSIVLIDDCRLPNGGKGKLVIERMLERGWRVLLQDYQVLLVR